MYQIFGIYQIKNLYTKYFENIYTGPSLASAEPDWKHFCVPSFSGVCKNVWGMASSHNHKNHELCKKRDRKG